MEDILKAAVAMALDKKAIDPVILDTAALTPITDYFMICGGQTTTHVSAIVDFLQRELDRLGLRLLHKEGAREARWVLLDYGWLVVHVMLRQERDFYQLERLWHDARRVQFGDDGGQKSGMTP